MIWGNGNTACWAMPGSEVEIAHLLRGLLSIQGCQGVFLEKVWGRQGNAARAMTTFMTHYGVLRGCVALMSIDGLVPSIADVLPTKWQRAFNAPKMSRDKTIKVHTRKKEHKRALYDIAKELFPDVDVTLKTCDALLIAEFGCREVWL